MASPATTRAPTAWWAARRWADCSFRSLRLRAPQPPPHPDQRLDQSPGAHPCQGPLRMLRRRLLLSKPRTRGPWRWTTSCPGTRAARTASATCRPSASAAMPASALARSGDSSYRRRGSVASTGPVGGGLRRGGGAPGSGTRHLPSARGSGLAPHWAACSGRPQGRRPVRGLRVRPPQSARRRRWGSRRGGGRDGAPVLRENR